MSMMFGHGRNTSKPECFPKCADIIRLWDSQTAWEQLNPAKDQYNWAMLDARLQEIPANMGVIYCMGRTPAWAALPAVLTQASAYSPTAHCPPDTGAYGAFVDALIAHAKGRIKYIESWNEWNAPGFWAGSIQQLVAMHNILCAKAHAAGIYVTTPTPCLQQGINASGATVNYSQWPTSDVALEALFKIGIPFDIVTFHGYIPNGADAYAIEPTLWNIQNVMHKYGFTNPLWDTEYGPNAPTNITADQQFAWTVKSLMKRQVYGLSLACWYQWDNQTHGTCVDTTGKLTTYGQAWNDFYYSTKKGMI